MKLSRHEGPDPAPTKVFSGERTTSEFIISLGRLVQDYSPADASVTGRH